MSSKVGYGSHPSPETVFECWTIPLEIRGMIEDYNLPVSLRVTVTMYHPSHAKYKDTTEAKW